jgi:hypothetical protein
MGIRQPVALEILETISSLTRWFSTPTFIAFLAAFMAFLRDICLACGCVSTIHLEENELVLRILHANTYYSRISFAALISRARLSASSFTIGG